MPKTKVEHHPSGYDEAQIRIRSKEPTRCEIEFYLRLSMPVFNDHFPSAPLIPGVVQLKWVMTYAADLIDTERPYRIIDLKFKRPMQPGETVLLTLSVENTDSLTFLFSSLHHEYASGLIHFVAS